MPQRPTMVLVYELHAVAHSNFESPLLIAKGRDSFRTASRPARAAALGEQLRQKIEKKLLAGINAMGLPAHPGDPSAHPPVGAILIRGNFSTLIDENPAHRNIIKFERDKSVVDADIYAVQSTTTSFVLTTPIVVPLLHFNTHAEGGPIPAALPISKAPPPGSRRKAQKPDWSAEGMSAYEPQIDQLADQTVHQALAHLSRYFASQGWIGRDHVTAAVSGL
ncbi:MAG: hypothetical protein IVW54_10545 [Candidatus Binataceae bacterium]|nr:hypothetical protein [Candidatus Binataceae bacterium]